MIEVVIVKATGIVRKVDELGRIVIPIELRRVLDVADKDPLEIYVDGERIILKKYQPYSQCMLTGEVDTNNLVLANGKIVLSPTGAKTLIEELEGFLKK